MKQLERIASIAFGAVFLVLSFAVALEAGMRKLLNISLQGVDELGGYCLGVGSALAFAVTLAGKAHIRIDLLHDRLPAPVRRVLNGLSVAALLLCAAALARMGWIALADSIDFNSTAQTPWATPLRYPQAIWLAALAFFVLVAGAILVAFLRSLLHGDWLTLDQGYSPRGSDDELAEELADIKARGAASESRAP